MKNETTIVNIVDNPLLELVRDIGGSHVGVDSVTTLAEVGIISPDIGYDQGNHNFETTLIFIPLENTRDACLKKIQHARVLSLSQRENAKKKN